MTSVWEDPKRDTKSKALVLISKWKENQISDQTTKKEHVRQWSLMKRIHESPEKYTSMTQLCPKVNDKEFPEICQDVKDIIKDNSNREAHEILMITGTVWYMSFIIS